jgi:NitT/TauT family transport system substrate-binding protein
MSFANVTRFRASTLLFGAAASCLFTTPGRAQTNARIRVATFAVENAFENYYARDMGFFGKWGLDADVQLLSGSSTIAAAVVSNAVDIGYAALDVLATLHEKDIPMVVIAPAGEYQAPGTSRDAALVLAANSVVRTAKDLNGKTIATGTFHSLPQTATCLWIDLNGGDSSTVKFVEIPFPAMAAAVAANRVDAAFVPEPFLAAATKSGRVLEYGYDYIAKHFLFGAWFATAQWAKDHPDLVTRFASAMHDTAVWANANPQKSGELLAGYTKIDPAVIANMTRARFSEQLTPAVMQPLIDLAAKYNGFNSFPAQELIYKAAR